MKTAIILTVLTLTAGCGANPRDQAGSSDAEAPSKSGGRRASQVAVSPDQALALERIAEKETGRCMRSHGWRYVIGALPASANAVDTPYGLDDVAFRKRYGFQALELPDGRPAMARGESHPDPAMTEFLQYQARFSKQQQQNFQRDLNGSQRRYEVPTPQGGSITAPMGGCFAVGTKAVYGRDLKRWWNAQIVVNQFSTIAQRQTWRAPRFRTAIDGWRECMRERGWSVEAGKRQPPAQLVEPNADQTQLNQFGVDDASCGTQHHVQALGESMESAARRQIERRYEAQLLVYNEIVRAAQARVASGALESGA